MRVALGAVCLMTVLAYQPIGSAGWVYEDSNAVMANASVTGQAPIAIDRARWLSALSHRLVYTVSPGPRLPHLVNLGLHLVNGGLVYAIGLVVVSPLAAGLAAALFLLHPLQTEAVAYVASRSELLAASFALMALWLSLERSRWRAIGTWTCVALALCAKESAAVIVPLIALVDLWRGRRLSWGRLGALLLPVALVAVSVLRLDYRAQSDLSALGYAATQATALWRYLALVVVPIGQSVDHDVDLVPWGVRYLALYGVVALAALPLLASLSVRDGDTGATGRLWDGLPRVRVLGFGVAWLLIALLPRFVMRLTETLNEHQTLIPFIGIWFIVGTLGDRLLAGASS